MDKAGNVEEIKSFKVAVHAPTIIPDFGPLVEEILDFLNQMGPAVLIILGFVVVIAGMTRSLVVLVGVGLVAYGLLILLGVL